MQINILEYGAVGDGVTSNTRGFRNAITEAAKNGGRVIVPDGIFLTGPIELLSNVELYLSDNAVDLFCYDLSKHRQILNSG